MTFYQELIIKATNCANEEVSEIEDYMRDIVLMSGLGSKTEKQLIKAAKESKADLDFMKSDEGLKYIESLNN